MPAVREILVYKFEELSDSAKENARDWWKSSGLDYEWWDCEYDSAKEIASHFGIEISNIYFSGFWCQGDGACFEGSYTHKKDWKETIERIGYGGEFLEKLMKWGNELEAIQEPARYSLTATMKHTGRYYHSGCMDVNVEVEDEAWDNVEDVFGEDGAEAMKDQAFEEGERPIIEFMRSFADWIYRELEKEYYWLMSDEQVDETIIANEYEFDEDGNRI